jgi:hypothetical protein
VSQPKTGNPILVAAKEKTSCRYSGGLPTALSRVRKVTDLVESRDSITGVRPIRYGRFPDKEEAAGSNPVTPTLCRRPVVQLVRTARLYRVCQEFKSPPAYDAG